MWTLNMCGRIYEFTKYDLYWYHKIIEQFGWIHWLKRDPVIHIATISADYLSNNNNNINNNTCNNNNKKKKNNNNNNNNKYMKDNILVWLMWPWSVTF